MPRSSRAAAGGVVVLVLLLVAAVSGLVAAVGAAQVRGDGWFVPVDDPGVALFTDPVTVEAEVLDVDGDQGDGWASVDVAFDTGGGGREVSVVDLGAQDGTSPPLPEVGDTITVVHERSDPSYALREDDPVLTGDTVDTGDAVDDVPGSTAEEAREAGEALVARTRALALGSLALAVLAVAATVVAVRRAPPARGWVEPPPPLAAEVRPPGEAPGR